MSRYAISDIHGCYNTLKALLNQIGLNKNDDLFLLGDYINRGKRSKEVLDLLIQLKNEGYNIVTLKGNHEAMVFDSLMYEDWTAGAPETLDSFGIYHLRELDSKYLNWLNELKLYDRSEDYIMVHAGLDFSKDNPLSDKTNLMWINNWYDQIDYQWLGKRIIVHGHSSRTKSEILKMRDELEQKQVLDIDNGCYKNGEPALGNLCCFELETRHLWFEAFKDND
jgi:serine/threonine protein phosphatase 1